MKQAQNNSQLKNLYITDRDRKTTNTDKQNAEKKRKKAFIFETKCCKRK